MIYRSRKRKIFLLGTVVILACHLGCNNIFTGKGKTVGEKVVAKVNNYEIFASDFAMGANAALASGEEHLTEEEIKDSILRDLITQKFLIYEAQQQNFDKQKPFIKEIERYWEQALLKSLLQKQSKEIAKGIIVDEGEVDEEYLRRKRKVFAQLVLVKSYVSAKKLAVAGNNFNSVREELGEEMISKDKAQWWLSGDLSLDIEKRLFSLGPEEISSPIKYDGNWLIMKALKVKELDVLPLKDVAVQIKQELAGRKKEEALKKWIEDLREKASVEIYHNILEGINLKDFQNINY